MAIRARIYLMRQNRPNRCAAAALVTCCLALAGWVAPPCPAADPSPDQDREAAADQPTTFEKVWYRTGKKRGLMGSSAVGALTVTPTEIRIDTRKKEIAIALDSIDTISFGKMRGDVDTDWIVLEIIEGESRTLVGLRDGRKFGYGQQTERLYELILDAIKRAGAAQYDVPEGYRAYDRLQAQFTLTVPQDWTAYPRSLIEVDGLALWGEIVFVPQSSVPDSAVSAEERQQLRKKALAAVDDGSSGAFYVDRREALRGMRCEGFSEKARATLLRWAEEDPLFAAGRGSEESTRTETVVIDDCNGLRIVRRSRQPGQEERILDLRAVSDDETVYVFGLRSREGRYAEDLERFDTAVRSVRFSVARSRAR
jgi:hypothetical protein